MKQITCINCGRVHIAYTLAKAKAEMDQFNRFFDRLPEEEQLANYKGKRATLDIYVGCGTCGQNNFRPSVEGDCPVGCTLSPVIWEEGESLMSLYGKQEE